MGPHQPAGFTCVSELLPALWLLPKMGEELGVAFQDVSQLFLAGAMLIVGVPKLGVHGQEPVKMLRCLLSKPYTRWQGSWTQHITWVPSLTSLLLESSLHKRVLFWPSLVGGTGCLKRERKEMLAQSQEVELGPEKLPPTSLPRPFRSELLCPPHTIPASQPDVRVGWQASYLRAETSRGRL